MELQLTDIISICKNRRPVHLFEPFLNHFGDIDYACILSEICVNSALSIENARDGWFKRPYEVWEKLTGISATRSRMVCLDLECSRLIEVKIALDGSHFKAIPETIGAIIRSVVPRPNRRISLGKCPECGSDVIEGTKSYHCSAWAKGEANVCCFCIWKDSLSRNEKFLITPGEARCLLAGDEIDLPDLVGYKDKKLFSCKGILQKRESGKFGIKFVKLDFKEEGVR